MQRRRCSAHPRCRGPGGTIARTADGRAHADEDDPMTEGTHQAPTDAPDASDVDTPIGRAVPTDPASSAPLGADLDDLPSLDEPGAGGSLGGQDEMGDGEPTIHERQDPDHIGVDWDLTEKTRD
jgi:hypothetical protein